MNIVTGRKNSKDIQIWALVVIFILFALTLLQHHSIFPDHWFPSQLAASAFTFLFCIWVLSEVANNAWSWKNSRTTAQDKGSYRVVIAAIWLSIFIVFILRSYGIGAFTGRVQYIGMILLAAGVVLREWAIVVLGKHFTVRVQVNEDARLVTQGPYSYIRHPAYTGNLLTLTGLSLAVGSWLGTIFVLVVIGIAHEYRIRIEEEALQKAFGPDYEEYKKRTWKLLPGY